MIYTPENMEEHNIESIRLFDEEQREIQCVTEIDTKMKSYKIFTLIGPNEIELDAEGCMKEREFIITNKHTIKIKYKE